MSYEKYETQARLLSQLRFDADFAGSRVFMLRHLKVDEVDLAAATAVLNLLVTLREASRYLLLGSSEIQEVINSFMRSAEIEEVETDMGEIVFQRKAS